MIEKAKETKNKIASVLVSKSSLSILLFLGAIALTVVESMMSVSWDYEKIEWGKFVWNFGLQIGLHAIGIACLWMFTGSILGRDDSNSPLGKAKKSYRSQKETIKPKIHYFSQFHTWVKSEDIIEYKKNALMAIGYRFGNEADSAEIPEATAEEIARYADENDIRRAMSITEDGKLIQCEHGSRRFYLTKKSKELGEATIRIINYKAPDSSFSSADDYLTEYHKNKRSDIMRTQRIKAIEKDNVSATVKSLLGTLLLFAAWSVLWAGSTIDKTYGNGQEVVMNLISRLISLGSGALKGSDLCSRFYEGLAQALDEKTNMLTMFYYSVMVDGTFKPKTYTKSAEEIYLAQMEEERKRSEEAKRSVVEAEKIDPPKEETKRKEKKELLILEKID